MPPFAGPGRPPLGRTAGRGRAGAGVPRAGRVRARRSLRSSPTGAPKGRAGPGRPMCRRSEARPGPLRAALPLPVANVGRPGLGQGQVLQTLSPQEFKWGGKRRSVGARSRHAERSIGGPSIPHPRDPEKPPRADEEVARPGNDLRSRDPLPGGPSRDPTALA